jgi:hypothetical protein
MLQFKFFAIAVLVVFAVGITNAQNLERTKTVNKSVKVPGDVTLQMNNYSGNLEIITSAENTVSIKTTVEISGDSKEDVDKVIAAVENFTFQLSGNTMEIDTRFYKSMNTINNHSTMTLENGDKVKIKDFKISHEMHIPKSASIKLNNKYSDIEIGPVDGNTEFVLYNSKLNAADFSGKLNIDAKYSKIKLGNVTQDASLIFYDTDTEIESCKNLTVNSKYSKFDINKAESLVIESYDDNFNVSTMSSLKFNSKYSDFVSQANLNEIKLDLYDCNITVNSAERAFFNGKYCDLNLGNIGEFKTDDSYDNNIHLANTKKVEVIQSKYCEFDFASVTSLKMADIYDDVIKIEKLNSDFSGISANGKYGKIDIEAGSVPFKVNFKIKNPKVDIPESVKIIKQIKDNSDLELVGGESGGTISVDGYDMKVVIND